MECVYHNYGWCSVLSGIQDPEAMVDSHFMADTIVNRILAVSSELSCD